MAVSKKSHKFGRSVELPDPMPFVQVYEQGLADLDDVVAAFWAVLAEWCRVFGQPELQPGDVVEDRREALGIAHNLVTARLVELHRRATWNYRSNEPQEEV